MVCVLGKEEMEHQSTQEQQNQQQQQQNQQTGNEKKDKKKKTLVKNVDLGIDSETHGLSQLQLNSYYEFEVSWLIGQREIFTCIPVRTGQGGARKKFWGGLKGVRDF